MARKLCEIAREIKSDWKKVNYAAAPYLDAMGKIGEVGENYYQEKGRDIVRYFLANAGLWRGEKAKAIKLELRSML